MPDPTRVKSHSITNTDFPMVRIQCNYSYLIEPFG